MSMFQSAERGQLLMVILVIVAFGAAAALFVTFRQVTPILTHETVISKVVPEEELTPQLIWSSAGSNSARGILFPGEVSQQIVRIGPTASVQLAVTAGGGTDVALINPQGKEVIASVSPKQSATITETTTGTTTTTVYSLTGNTQSGDWTVVLGNSSTAETPFTIVVPVGAPPLTISPQVNETANNSKNITIALTVEESIGEVVKPVTGAEVIAHVTSPSEVVSLLVLVETNPTTNPGVYSGVYTGAQSTGLYEVEYFIHGYTSFGTEFTQTASGEFAVTPEPTTPYLYGKKYDINRGGEVQLIGY